MWDYHLILAVYDVGVAAQSAEQTVFVADLLYLFAQLRAHGKLAHGFEHLVVLLLRAGNAYHLERTVEIAAVFIFFLQLIYLAGAAAAYAAHYLPAGQRRLQILHIMHP